MELEAPARLSRRRTNEVESKLREETDDNIDTFDDAEQPKVGSTDANVGVALQPQPTIIETLPPFQPFVFDRPSPTQITPQSFAHPYADTPESGPAPGESPTSRWLDLLIADATLHESASSELHRESNGFDIFGNSVAQTPVATPVPPPSDDGEWPRNTTVPLTRNAHLLERTPYNGDYLREQKAWAAVDPIELQPREHVLFSHFVQHISRWVKPPT